MNKWIALLLVGLLATMPVFALADALRPMGRYVESEIKLPADVEYVNRVYSDVHNELAIIGSTAIGAASFDYIDSAWMETTTNRILPEYGFFDIDECNGEMIMLYCTGEVTADMIEMGEDVGMMLGRCVDGALLPIDINISETSPDKIAIASNGTILVQGDGGSIFCFDVETSKQLQRYDDLDGPFIVHETTLFAISTTEQSLHQIDLTTGQVIYEMKNAPTSANDVLAFDGQAVYVANAGGVYRIMPGGSIWEQLVDGDLTSLSLPMSTLDSMAVDNGRIYISLYNEIESRLLQYDFDSQIGTLPQYELRIYALHESNVLSLAAIEFQKENPDYRVSITVLLSDDTAITNDEAIRALSTELLAGKGPDVLLLDGMPISDYAQKNVLYDLKPLFSELDSGGELVSSVFAPFLSEDKAYFAPTSCELPTVLLANQMENQPLMLDDLPNILCDSSYASPIAWRTKQGYFNSFLSASYPAWFLADGGLDEEIFCQYLTSIDAIYESMSALDETPERVQYQRMIDFSDNGDAVMAGNDVFPYDLSLLENGSSVLYPTIIGSFNRSMLELTMLSNADGSLAWMPGQAQHVYMPTGLLGINARGNNIDASLSFVRVALSQSVQGVDIYGGLPVNLKSLHASISKNSSNSAVARGYTDLNTFATVILKGEWPVLSIRESVLDMVLSVQTPYIPDHALLSMITNALAPYFDCEMDAQTATQQVAAKVHAYLAE